MTIRDSFAERMSASTLLPSSDNAIALPWPSRMAGEPSVPRM
jgi:hypothetical protein